MAFNTAVTAVLAAVLLSGSAIAKQKEPSQPDVVAGCVTATQIQQHGAGVSAVLINNCNRPVTVFISMAYFNRKGEQMSDDKDMMTLAAGAQRRMIHALAVDWLFATVIKTAQIIGIQTL